MANNDVQIIKNELVKHSGAIHIYGDLNITQRKISNSLLKNAYNDLLKKETHVINLSTLMKEIGYNSNNISALKENIIALMKTIINWNILSKDNKNEWVASPIISSTKIIEGGIIEYSYSPHLKQLLARPNIYARLNLIIQKKFKSVYSLTLWEFLLETLCSVGRDEINTEWYSIEEFKKIMCVKEHEHKQFKMLNFRLVKEPIKEINKVSDIIVDVQYKKEGRKVVALSFNVKRKINYQMDFETTNTNPDKTSIVNDNNNLESILQNEFSIAEKKSQTLISNYPEKNIQESLEYVRNELQTKNKIKNLAAFTVKAIEEKWSIVKEIDNKKQLKKIKITDIESRFNDPIWTQVWNNLKEDLEEGDLISWISHLNLNFYNDTKVELIVYNNNFIKEYIELNFTPIILKAFKKFNESICKIDIKLVTVNAG